jgi:hypothetical protein
VTEAAAANEQATFDSLANGTTASFVVFNFHFNNSKLLPTGNPLCGSFNAITLSFPPGANLAAFGWCLNCTSFANSEEEEGVRRLSRSLVRAGSETRSSKAPFSSRDRRPPSRRRERERVSRTEICTLRGQKGREGMKGKERGKDEETREERRKGWDRTGKIEREGSRR